MIKEWQISNFKSISQENPLRFSPLTIFAGANSCGKSTIIQSILLITQTLSNKVASRPIVLNGHLSTLGQFNDIKSKSIENNQNEILIKCTYESSFKNKDIHHNHQPYSDRVYDSVNQYQTRRHSSNDIMNISFDVCFDADPLSQKAELFQIQPRLKSTNLSCSLKNISTENANIKINHTNHSIVNLEDTNEISDFDDQFRSSLSYSITLDHDSLLDLAEGFKSVKLIGCYLNHFLPDYIVYTVENAEINAKLISKHLQNLHDFRQDTQSFLRNLPLNIPKEITFFLKKILKDEIKLDLDSKITTLQDLFEALNQLEETDLFKIKLFFKKQDHLFENIYLILKDLNIDSNDVTIFKRSIPNFLKNATKQVDDFFSLSLKYLGPLRDTPKQLYPLSPNIDPNHVGIQGENTALVFELNKNKKIQYIPSSYFANHNSTENIEKFIKVQTLECAVIDWLEYLGVAQSIQTKDKGNLGYELKVITNRHSKLGDDLIHVGVGVSQVLPILVMCLLSDVGTTLIIEQPELHLHPKVQTLLADFFLSITFCHKQCIIESHSEYLVDRLRFRIASTSNSQTLNEAVTVYFVEKEGQNSKFTEVEINEYGAILEWPEGFFDQSQKQAEEILNAAMKKRMLNRKSK